MTSSSNSIVGTSDGVAPVYNLFNGLFHIWALTEIFTGSVGTNAYVPNVGDYVVDTSTDTYYKCTAVDQTTWLSTLNPVTAESTGEFTETDLLLGVGPGTPSDTFRIYIDKTNIPSVMAVDARLHIFGTDAVTAKIFKGSLLDGSAQVISAFYDQSGNLTGQAINLELAGSTSGTVTFMGVTFNNFSVKSIPICYTTDNVQDGEVLTAVIYDAANNVLSKRQLLAENTAFIRSSDSSVKSITGIALETPFLSQSDPFLIQYPLNLPINSFNLMGTVNYSDGSSLTLPVDGTKFSIFGLDDYISTIVGQKIPLVLKYSLSSDEIIYGASATSTAKFVEQLYSAQTLNADGSFTVKLYGFPVWSNTANSYSLEWYLYNLDRQVVYAVTPYVTINTNSPAFNPTGYGILQNLSVSINMNKVNPAFENYIQVQTIGITLSAAGTDRSGTNWTVAFSPGQNPPFGVGNNAVSTFINENLSTVAFDVGATSQADWLNRLYFATQPLTDPTAELAPPTPNMFSLLYAGQEFEFTIDQWNVAQQIGVGLINNDTLLIKFFLRTADNDIQLSMAGLPIWQSN